MADVFTFTTDSGETIELAPFKSIPSGVFRKARSLNYLDQIFSLIESAADEENLAKVDAIPVDQIDALFEAWADGADVPKS